MNRTRCAWLLLPLLAGCPGGDKAGPPSGTKIIDWTRGPTTFSTGVSVGEDIGPLTVEQKLVTFTPEERHRDKSHGPVRLALRIERGQVGLREAPGGGRPAEQAASPKHIEVKLLENGGWQVTGDCEKPLQGPADIGNRRVGLYESCLVKLRSGSYLGDIVLSVGGEGKLLSSGAFGQVAVVDTPP